MRIFQHWKILMRSVQGLFFFHFQMRLLKAEGLSGFLIAFLHSIHFAYEVMVLKEISTTQKLILFLYQITLWDYCPFYLCSQPSLASHLWDQTTKDIQWKQPYWAMGSSYLPERILVHPIYFKVCTSTFNPWCHQNMDTSLGKNWIQYCLLLVFR